MTTDNSDNPQQSGVEYQEKQRGLGAIEQQNGKRKGSKIKEMKSERDEK
ncbi:hypothetical protein [Dickeya parazeae]|nr:hypothetical protein [Dickeya parazeae]